MFSYLNKISNSKILFSNHLWHWIDKNRIISVLALATIAALLLSRRFTREVKAVTSLGIPDHSILYPCRILLHKTADSGRFHEKGMFVGNVLIKNAIDMESMVKRVKEIVYKDNTILVFSIFSPNDENKKDEEYERYVRYFQNHTSALEFKNFHEKIMVARKPISTKVEEGKIIYIFEGGVVDVLTQESCSTTRLFKDGSQEKGAFRFYAGRYGELIHGYRIGPNKEITFVHPPILASCRSRDNSNLVICESEEELVVLEQRSGAEGFVYRKSNISLESVLVRASSVYKVLNHELFESKLDAFLDCFEEPMAESALRELFSHEEIWSRRILSKACLKFIVLYDEKFPLHGYEKISLKVALGKIDDDEFAREMEFLSQKERKDLANIALLYTGKFL